MSFRTLCVTIAVCRWSSCRDWRCRLAQQIAAGNQHSAGWLMAISIGYRMQQNIVRKNTHSYKMELRPPYGTGAICDTAEVTW